jgi:signal transduction histidine kinase/CheY-like chemotaxis protein
MTHGVADILGAICTGLALIAVLAFARLFRDARHARDDCRRHADRLQREVAAHSETEAELARARDAAEAANAAKTRYLVAVSHEIRSPLNAIFGYAQLLERGDAIRPTEAGEVIRRSAEHLTNLVEGLLDISRVESGVLQVRQDIVRLPALLDHIVAMFRMQADAKGLSLDYVVEGRLPPFVRTDEKRLRQILINLLSNAIKYTHAGGATLTVRYRSQTASIEVRDTGIGIAADDLERIFEPFERGSMPDAAKQPGIGLGLAITRVLTRILGGEVTVTSEPGQGSRFLLRMLLPEPIAAPAGAPTYARVVGYQGPRKTILVIDDNPAQVTIVNYLLRPLDFAVFEANGGADGLALAERCAPDLVLLDIQMPGSNGWDVAAQLRERFGRAVRIVMVSANAHEFRNGQDGRGLHDAFLTKPVDLDALLDAVARQLGLDWILAEEPGQGGPPAVPQPVAPSTGLPASAMTYVDDIQRYIKLGHVRAIESVLNTLDAEVPESAALVTELRRLLHAFDLRALARVLDDAA